MSYCRFTSDSEVYCYMDCDGGYTIEIAGEDQTINVPTPRAAADRLQLLKDHGFKVPQYAIDKLRAESDDEPLSRPLLGDKAPRISGPARLAEPDRAET